MLPQVAQDVVEALDRLKVLYSRNEVGLTLSRPSRRNYVVRAKPARAQGRRNYVVGNDREKNIPEKI